MNRSVEMAAMTTTIAPLSRLASMWVESQLTRVGRNADRTRTSKVVAIAALGACVERSTRRRGIPPSLQAFHVYML